MWRDNRGVVLMEVVMAFAVLLIGMLPLINAINSITRQLENGAQKLVALELAQSKMEEVTGRDYPDICGVDKTDWPHGYGYQFAVEVREPDHYGGCLKNICVTVFYYDHVTGREKRVALTGARSKG